MRYAFAMVLLLGCAAGSPPPMELAAPADLVVTTDAAPADVVRAAMSVLTAYGVPIQLHDPGAGLVQSMELTHQGMWGEALVRDRIWCGRYWDSGVEVALSNPVRLTLGVVALPRTTGGSEIRITFNGVAETGPRPIGSQTTFACQLTRHFARELLDALQAQLSPRSTPA